MRLTRTFTRTALILLAGCGLWAGDYDALFQTVKQQWPGRKQGVVACNRQASQAELDELGKAAASQGISLILMNIQDSNGMSGLLQNLSHLDPGFAVLVDGDPVLGAATKEGKRWIRALKHDGIPVVGTSEEALKAGASMVVGPKTSGKVLAAAEDAKVFKLKLPESSIVG